MNSVDYVVAEGVDLTYGSEPILRDISLTVPSPGTVAITGPSGSGKTSLLYALSGLERRASGSVRLLGEDLAAMTPDEIAEFRLFNVGFVFQSADLVPELTVRQNVSLPLELGGVGRREVSSRVTDLLRRLGLADSADRRPNQVSGGQAQRCAVARAVVATPRLVFADEPTGALDQVNRDAVLSLLLEQVRDIGGLLVTVTHDPAVAERFDQRVVLADGRIVADTADAGLPAHGR